MGHNIFISHHTDSCKTLVEILVTMLEKKQHVCWFAERDIQTNTNFTAEIPKAIKNCDVFLLILNRQANTNEHVNRETNIAMSLKKTILAFKIEDFSESDSMLYITSTNQYVKLTDVSNLYTTAELICNALEQFDKGIKIDPEPRIFNERDKNRLEFYAYENERNRLETQRRLIKEFAKQYYDDELKEYEDLVFLDVGCNTGEMADILLKDRKKYTYVGVDIEADALTNAKNLFPDKNFYQADCESNTFDEELNRIEKELHIDGFDVINISMLLLHLKNPEKLLDILCDHLNEGGKFIILDIDDGFNVAYPDPNDIFAQAVKLCAETIYSGYRKSGRQINSYLTKLGLSEIKLLNQGISTVGMSRKERSDFFNIYFWFIYDDLKTMHELYPNNEKVKLELNWIESHYDDMLLQFKEKGFFFNLGFMLFMGKN